MFFRRQIYKTVFTHTRKNAKKYNGKIKKHPNRKPDSGTIIRTDNPPRNGTHCLS